MTQTDLADAMGISRRTIAAFEAGSREPRRALLLAWAMATAVDAEWLETGQAGPVSTPPDSVHPLGLEPRTQWFRATPRRLTAVPDLEAAA